MDLIVGAPFAAAERAVARTTKKDFQTKFLDRFER